MSVTFEQNLDYWIHKTKVFLHDPPDKAIHIPGHEERANEILAATGLSGSSLDKDEYGEADRIASGMDRATLPGYVAKDKHRNGAVDFCEHPAITHPTGSDDELKIKLPEALHRGKAAVDIICAEIQELLKKDLGSRAGSGEGLSEKEPYRGQEENFVPARFHYLFFLLRRRLAANNVGGLGGLWHRLPADTRLPDHSIWQHNGLVSALASSMKLSASGRASLMVYALTPVQDFIGRARKLRDYWSGSVILSWLAFEGIKAVIYRYGADHIVYPSLHGQPLVEGLLREWQMNADWLDKGMEQAGVASFPNKFVCIVPAGEEKEAAAAIREAVQKAWLNLGELVLNLLLSKTGDNPEMAEQFRRQISTYWEYNWGAAPLVRGAERAQVEELLNRKSIDPAFKFWQDSQDLYTSSGEGQLYSVSHRLAQAMLAAGKSCRADQRGKEKGIKCDLFGEFEILHDPHGDKNPRASADPFWQRMRERFGESEFGKTERLCALAVIKRLTYRACRDDHDHPLQKMFKNADIFPSTTEMALYDWWRQLEQRAKDQDNPDKAKELAEALADFRWPDKKEKIRQKLAQWYHELNEPEISGRQGHHITEIEEKERTAARQIINKLHKIKDVHKYYAVLLMDGDRMGRLVNGETLGSTWKTVLHPRLADRLRLDADFEKKFKKLWQKRLDKKRLISPAVHAAISEALGDFSLHTVPEIIEKKYHGRLIYAGGDDVCAVLPVSRALDAAREIAAAYSWGFVLIGPDGQVSPCSDWQENRAGKLALHLGRGAEISISAGIMIAHHKKPLGKVMRRAHELLEQAKDSGGRNAFALELDKRSGGGRIFQGKWREGGDGGNILHHFFAAADALGTSEQSAMSSSLAYRLGTFQDGLLAMVDQYPEQLQRFIAKQLDRSGLAAGRRGEEKDALLMQLAGHVGCLINSRNQDGELPLEALVIANFIGHCRQERAAAQLETSRGAI
ncbi:CRISPR-associated protein [bacterium BMS3Abin13]|nr:CRISPR-associated protein [bacterium BMS3Abin13]